MEVTRSKIFLICASPDIKLKALQHVHIQERFLHLQGLRGAPATQEKSIMCLQFMPNTKPTMLQVFAYVISHCTAS